MGSGRVEKDRADTPNQTERPRVFGREEETLSSVAQAILGTILCDTERSRHILHIEKVVLRNHWDDRAQNKVPIFANRNRNDRLNVKSKFVAVVGRP